MGFVYTRQDEKVVLMLLRVLTAFFAVCIVSKVWTSMATLDAAGRMAEAAARVGAASQGAAAKDDEPDVLEPVLRQHLFALRPPKEDPVLEVTGLLGNEAFINGRWRRVGDMIGQARLCAVEATCVKVLWEGQTLSYSPVQAAGSSTSGVRQSEGQRASSAGSGPAREENIRTYQPTAGRPETPARQESYRPMADTFRERTTFSPGRERSFEVVPDPMDRMRQIAELQYMAELGSKPPRPPGPSPGPK